jgi:hypothetical protein
LPAIQCSEWLGIQLQISKQAFDISSGTLVDSLWLLKGTGVRLSPSPPKRVMNDYALWRAGIGFDL